MTHAIKEHRVFHIAAVNQEGFIGIGNGLPWGVREDLFFFQRVTTGNVVIMGRKTYESIGKPLRNRFNIVVSSTMEDDENELMLHVAKDIDEALAKANEVLSTMQLPIRHTKEPLILFIGGEYIYNTTLGNIDGAIITKIHTDVEFNKIIRDKSLLRYYPTATLPEYYIYKSDVNRIVEAEEFANILRDDYIESINVYSNMRDYVLFAYDENKLIDYIYDALDALQAYGIEYDIDENENISVQILHAMEALIEISKDLEDELEKLSPDSPTSTYIQFHLMEINRHMQNIKAISIGLSDKQLEKLEVKGE